MDENEKESRWLPWLQLVVVPLSLLLLGSTLDRWAGSGALDSQYVALAIDLLSSPPSDDEDHAAADDALRSWAIDLLSETSPVDVAPELRDAFETGLVVLPSSSPLVSESGFVVEIGSIGPTEVRYRFRAIEAGSYVAEVFDDRDVVHTATGEARADQLVDLLATSLQPGVDYTIRVQVDAGTRVDETTTGIRTPGGEPPEVSEQVELQNLRLTDLGSTFARFDYQTNVCANGSFTISGPDGSVVGSNQGQADGCGQTHFALPGQWTAALAPGTTYTIVLTVEANGRGLGDGNLDSVTETFTTDG